MYGPTPGDMWVFAIIVALTGAMVFEGCKCGCSYVARHVEIHIK